MQQRLLRTELLLGKDALIKLQNSKVLLIGLGGVGGYALEVLGRSGIMNFTLIDSDKFDETNLNRQILCTNNTINNYKTISAKERLLSIDKEITANTFELFLDKSNIKTILNFKYDLVVDAIDSLESKALLLEYCYKNNIKIVSSMGAGFRTDPTLVSYADISKCYGDPLAKSVRRLLIEKGISEGIPCVYSKEKPIKHDYKTIASITSVTGAMGLALGQLAINELIK